MPIHLHMSDYDRQTQRYHSALELIRDDLIKSCGEVQHT